MFNLRFLPTMIYSMINNIIIIDLYLTRGVRSALDSECIIRKTMQNMFCNNLQYCYQHRNVYIVLLCHAGQTSRNAKFVTGLSTSSRQ